MHPPTRLSGLYQYQLKTTDQYRALRCFFGRSQAIALAECLRGEENEYFTERMEALAQLVETMPKTYEQDGKGSEAVAYLHYFSAACDWWITELDAGAEGDAPGQKLTQCFGAASLNGGEAELGYISLPEILACGAELDLYWKPKTLAEAAAARPY